VEQSKQKPSGPPTLLIGQYCDRPANNILRHWPRGGLPDRIGPRMLLGLREGGTCLGPVTVGAGPSLWEGYLMPRRLRLPPLPLEG